MGRQATVGGDDSECRLRQLQGAGGPLPGGPGFPSPQTGQRREGKTFSHTPHQPWRVRDLLAMRARPGGRTGFPEGSGCIFNVSAAS